MFIDVWYNFNLMYAVPYLFWRQLNRHFYQNSKKQRLNLFNFIGTTPSIRVTHVGELEKNMKNVVCTHHCFYYILDCSSDFRGKSYTINYLEILVKIS